MGLVVSPLSQVQKHTAIPSETFSHEASSPLLPLEKE